MLEVVERNPDNGVSPLTVPLLLLLAHWYHVIIVADLVVHGDQYILNKSPTFCLLFLIKLIASLSREVKKVRPQVEFVCSRGRPDDPKDNLLYIHDHCSSVMVMLIPRDGLEADPVSKVGRTGGSTCFAAAPECPQFSPLCFIRPFSFLQCSQFDLHSVLFYQGTVFLLFIAMECLLRMLTNPF